ncbi:adenylylsulfate reductase subunit B [Ruminiclostridium sufflavum DSM 19573]|uniref:Adenylylsulfate reductase subunit B n=1 Tax=Ruminiclostridium sufflavum DSM 19573 TaxID=1121337 RepID=A0A318XFZ3_9FIRM|nr:ferredoxin family protein [Ruminiclostridium sufflavum]PYG84862.1 adenylylsulfate reductase subunit B [Ruminiclostridium sufflavum DSM 19573]
MSIKITLEKCIGCGSCVSVCPGSLIEVSGGKAAIYDPKRCWGCASCVKECPVQAIALYLGEDIGGLGGKLTVRQENTLLYWTVLLPSGEIKTIITDRQKSNQY